MANLAPPVTQPLTPSPATDKAFTLEGLTANPQGFATPVVPDLQTNTEVHTQEIAQEQQNNAVPLGDVVAENVAQNQIVPLLMKQAGREDLLDDPAFQLTSDVFKEHVQKDVPEEFWDEFDPDDIKSLGQLQQRKAELVEWQESQKIAQAKGVGTGVGLSVLASVLDPAAYALALGTEGVLAPVILTNKLTRLGRAVKGGLLASAGTAPVEGYLAYQDPTYDASDAIISTLTAGAFVGAIAGRMTPEERVLSQMRTSLVAHEAAQSGAVATPKGQKEFAGNVNPDGSFKTAAQVNKDFFKRNARSGTFAANWRLDRGADNFSSNSPKVRALSSVLFDDVAPAKGVLQGETASLWKTRERGRVTRDYMKSHKNTLKAFTEETGASWTKGFQTQKEFNKLVTKALRGQEVTSEAVKKHATEVRRLYDEIAEMARNPGGKEGIGHAIPVKGAEDMKVEDYVNRRWSPQAMDNAIERLGSADAVQKLIASSIRNMDSTTAMEVAGHLMSVTKRSKMGGLDLNRLEASGENLELFLTREHGLKPEEAGRIAGSLKRLTGGTDAGRTGNLKHRLDIDEAMVEDLLESDIDSLFGSYSNTMLGNIALARHGIDSEDTFRRLVQDAQDESYSPAIKSGMDQRKRDRESVNLQEAYDHLIGRPVRDNPASGFSTTGRLLRKFNYSRLMNMVGIAQLAELSNIMAHTGVKAFLANVPELAKLKRRAASGDFTDELLEELSDLTGGLGDFRLLHRSAQRVEEFGGAEGMREGWLSWGERKLDGMNNITSDISGFNLINQQLHAMTLKSMTQTFMDAARTGKHTLSVDRLRELGIDDALMKNIKKELMKASRDGNGKVKKLNLEDWDDATRVKFGNALRRWNNTIIQENDFGVLPGFMSHPAVKLLMQFKSFMVGAYSKQLLNNIKHADRKTAMVAIGGLVGGCLSYTTYVYASAIGREDKEQYLKRMMSTKALAAGSLQRSSWASIMPGIIDIPSSLGAYDPIFDTRAGSGLNSNWLTGSASYDLAVNGVGKLGSELVESAKQQEFTQNTARSIAGVLPFQNALVIRNVLNTLYGHLRTDPNYD